MVPFLVRVKFWLTVKFFGDWRLLFGFYDHWVRVNPSSFFTFCDWRMASILQFRVVMVVPSTMNVRTRGLRFGLRLRLRLRLRYGVSMPVPLVIDVALLTIVPIVGLFPPNNLNFSE